MKHSHLLLTHIQYTSAGTTRRHRVTRTWPYLLAIGLALGTLLGTLAQ